MPQSARSKAEWSRIREVFERRRAAYGLTEVTRLLAVPKRTVEEEIAEGTVTALQSDGGVFLSWEDVVILGLNHRWTYRSLTAALKGVGASNYPPLVLVVPRRVALPRYQWNVLRILANRQSATEQREVTVSDLLERAVTIALLTPITDWRSLEEAAPGVTAASAWPSDPSYGE